MPLGPQGWVRKPDEVEAYLTTLPHPIFGLAADSITDSGKGKVVLLHKCVENVIGKFPIHRQTIGDCVSHGFGLGVDVLMCVEIDRLGHAEEWRGETATEPLYACGRVEIGGGKIRGDGSVGAWQAKAVSQYGTNLRKRYGNIDLSVYDGSRAREWGKPGKGVPDSLEPEMAEHLVKSTSLVASYEEARDAIANGYPIPVCSMQGFSDRRDAEGFSRPQGSWAHCMLFMAVDDEHRRPGLLCMNSWGIWNSGPKRHGQPDGSFWVDADVADRMLRRGRDSFSLSQHEGYPAQNLDYLLI